MSREEWRGGQESLFDFFFLSKDFLSIRLDWNLENEKSGTTCKRWVASQPDRQLLQLFPFIFLPLYRDSTTSTAAVFVGD